MRAGFEAVIFASAILVGIMANAYAPMILVVPVVHAQEFPAQGESIYLTVENTVYGTEKVIVLRGSVQLFEQQVTIDVSDSKLKKIEKIFDKTQFEFGYEEPSVTKTYYPWKVTLSVDQEPYNVPAGFILKVQFT